MKTVEPPKCNASLVAEAIAKNTRIDGRARDATREYDLAFGRDFGTCIVTLGNTRVMGKVTAEIVEPLGSRPSEGALKISVDLSPMASPYHSGRGSSLDESVEIVRLLERSVRDSKCIDMEGLCLISGEKCWQIRVDLIAFNNEGNLVEAFSIAMIASLAHFKRPDVTVTDELLTIHSFDEKHPLPLTILHYPFCIKFCFFNQKKHSVIDPVELEEQTCEGYMVTAGNSYRELTTIHVTGKSLLDKENILRCCGLAIERIIKLTEDLKMRLADDKAKREDKSTELGFAAHLRGGTSLILAKRNHIDITARDDEEMPEAESFDSYAGTRAYRFNNTETSGVGEGGPSTWDYLEEGEIQEDALMEPREVVYKNLSTKPALNQSNDSSDDEVVVLKQLI